MIELFCYADILPCERHIAKAMKRAAMTPSFRQAAKRGQARAYTM